MSDQSPPVDPAHSQGPNSAGETAQKLANQTIDTIGQVAKLAVDVPKDTAKLLLSETKKLVERLEKVLD